MKKIMILGASFLQTFIIREAKEMGYYCIAVDGNPNSEGFAMADKYYVCSTTDYECVLKYAELEAIDGILTYASDVAAPVVAYVAEKLGLHTNPYESVKIMTDKVLTRNFMAQNGFNVPKSEEVSSLEGAKIAANRIGFPVIFKPVDSAGSKGVSKAEKLSDIEEAFIFALDNSRSKRVIVEQFLVRKGYQIDADCFMYKGELLHFLPMDQHRDMMAPYSPIGISAPSMLSKEKKNIAFSEVERFLKLLKMNFGEFNVEYIFDQNDELYILEIGPRAGGNLIPDVVLASAGINLRTYSIKACMGEDCSNFESKEYKKYISSYIIHSQRTGIFEGIQYDKRIEDKILIEKLFVKKGDMINRFTGCHDALGFSLIEFPSVEVMNEIMDATSNYIEVQTN